MSVAVDILSSEHVGVRELRDNLSRIVHKSKPVIVTDRGVPAKVLLPYSDMVELLEIIDEIFDRDVAKTVSMARKTIARGVRGVPVAALFKKLRKAK